MLKIQNICKIIAKNGQICYNNVMNIIIATNNDGKMKEIRELLKDKFENIYSLKDKDIDIDIVEDADTFEGNAKIKATTIAKLTGMCAIGDDSGLVVNALNGAPGVYSARYSGEPVSHERNNEKLIKEMDGKEDRSAYFVTVVAFASPDGKVIFAEGRVGGKILEQGKGNDGFGYDPLFYSNDLGKTFAEASLEEKNLVSHRSRAFKALVKKL